MTTSSLEEMIDNDEDLEYLNRQFKIYESNIDFLVKEKNKLRTIKESEMVDRVQDQISDLEKIIDDPWLLDQVVEKMQEIEKAIEKAKENNKRQEEETKRRTEIRKSLDKLQIRGIQSRNGRAAT